jgi:hypothetical protein
MLRRRRLRFCWQLGQLRLLRCRLALPLAILWMLAGVLLLGLLLL